jgi:predicted chitinase
MLHRDATRRSPIEGDWASAPASRVMPSENPVGIHDVPAPTTALRGAANQMLIFAWEEAGGSSMTTINISQIRSLAPKPIDQYNKAFSAANVATILDTYQISNAPLRVCHFFAQILTETGRLQVLAENLDYTADRLRQVWPSRFPTLEFAEQYAHDGEKLANYVYANRLGNGDAASDDGFNFRGRGLLQITGKAAYARLGKQLGIALVTNPDLAFDPEWCLAAAAAEWSVSGYDNRYCNELADEDDISGVTHAINGGLTDIEERMTWLKRCKAIWLPEPALASRAAARA